MFRLGLGRRRAVGRRTDFTEEAFLATEVLFRTLDFTDFAGFVVFFVRVDLPLTRDDVRLTTI